MPHFQCCGSHEPIGIKYRSIGLERFEEDRQKLLDRRWKTLLFEIAFSHGMHGINVLEYVHSYESIHAAAKPSSTLPSFGKGNENFVHLLNIGWACRYTQNGKRRDYKDDFMKTHDGTIEFASLDVHTGAHSRSGSMEQGYNLLWWLRCRLPWKDNLQNPEYVSQQKSIPMEAIPLLMSKCFPHGEIPCGITEFLQYVASMNLEDAPDYNRLMRIFENDIQAVGLKPDSGLLLKPPRTPRRNSFSPKKPVLQVIILVEGSVGESGNEGVVGKPLSSKSNRDGTTLASKRNHPPPSATKSSLLDSIVKLEHKKESMKNKAASFLSARTSSKDSLKNGFCEESNSMGLHNSTSTFAAGVSAQACTVGEAAGRAAVTGQRSSTRPPANHFPLPPWQDGLRQRPNNNNAPRPAKND